MIVTILVSAGLILVLATLFALSSGLLGRSDQPPGCGSNSCDRCHLASPNGETAPRYQSLGEDRETGQGKGGEMERGRPSP